MDFNVNKSANQENLAENENQRQEEKERKWRDPNEDVKYVCEGGKVQCKHCSSPVATLKVTAENVMLQDKPWANAGDNNGLANFAFNIHTAIGNLVFPIYAEHPFVYFQLVKVVCTRI